MCFFRQSLRQKVDGITFHLHRLEIFLMAKFDEVLAKVTALETANDSLIALAQGLAQEIRDNASDPVALQALADRLDTDTAKVVAAVTANTPVAP